MKIICLSLSFLPLLPIYPPRFHSNILTLANAEVVLRWEEGSEGEGAGPPGGREPVTEAVAVAPGSGGGGSGGAASVIRLQRRGQLTTARLTFRHCDTIANLVGARFPPFPYFSFHLFLLLFMLPFVSSFISHLLHLPSSSLSVCLSLHFFLCSPFILIEFAEMSAELPLPPPPPPSPSLLQMKTETKISTIRYFASENATTETVALFDVYLSSIDSY